MFALADVVTRARANTRSRRTTQAEAHAPSRTGSHRDHRSFASGLAPIYADVADHSSRRSEFPAPTGSGDQSQIARLAQPSAQTRQERSSTVFRTDNNPWSSCGAERTQPSEVHRIRPDAIIAELSRKPLP